MNSQQMIDVLGSYLYAIGAIPKDRELVNIGEIIRDGDSYNMCLYLEKE